MIVDEEGVVENPYIGYASKVDFDPKDIRPYVHPRQEGDEHGKVVRGIMAYAEIDAPRYWWQEMDTYRIGTDRLF